MEEDTQTESKTVQVLQPDTLNVDKTSINTTDKYVGYKLDKEKTNIPDEIENGGVVNVYYVKDDFNYTVKYYYDGEIDNSKTEIIEAKYQDVISTYTDKNITGYKLEKTENLPLTVTEVENNNVIKVYYILDDEKTKELSYTVEYYKDNVLQESDTQTTSKIVQVLEPDTLIVDFSKINTKDKYIGYKLSKTSPANIPNSVENGTTIKVYYGKDSFDYTIEYYYEGIIDKSKTHTEKALYETIIKDYEDKNIEGYRFEKTEGAPLKVSENESENIIRVYYIIDDGNTKTLNYTVEYYKDGVLQEGDTQTESKTVQVLEPDTLNVDTSKINKTNKYTGYKLQKTEPEAIPSAVNNGDVIRVYYVKDNFDYTVEYYYDDVKDETKTEVLNSRFESIIKTYPDKSERKYDAYKTENLPLKITEDSSKNIIKIYYTKKESTITVHYYVEGTEESISKDLVIKDKVDTVHKIAPAKDVPEKYELVKSPENEELTMTVESIEVTYFYRVKDSKVIVRYIDKEKNNVLDEEIINGKVGDTYKTEAKTIESYNLITEELPLNKEGIMKVNEITVNYYYKKAPSNIPEPSGTTNNNIQKEETNLKEEKDSNVVNTGDNLPTILISIIVLVIVMNLVQMKVSTASQISSKARTFRKIRKIRKNSNERVARISRIYSTKRCKRKKSKTRGRRAK